MRQSQASYYPTYYDLVPVWTECSDLDNNTHAEDDAPNEYGVFFFPRSVCSQWEWLLVYQEHADNEPGANIAEG
jgi:hypothetical protein